MSDEHSAEAAALGFYYQSFYALLTLVTLTTDNASIGIEQLDDIVLNTDGQKLLYQLKHSLKDRPPSISLKSKSLWRTMKVWIDALPSLSLDETTLHLVTVGGIQMNSPLLALTNRVADRTDLLTAMTAEAQRVVDEIAKAKAKQEKYPHADRADGCISFLSLTDPERLNLLRRVQICPDCPKIDEIEQKIAEHLNLIPPAHRLAVSARLVEWWDRQIIYSLCGTRERIVTREELQCKIMEVIAEIEHEKLTPDFETLTNPTDYQPDGMLTRQIKLVNGQGYDIQRAILAEWRARSQRSKWINSNPALKAKITEYDFVLHEKWSDRHIEMTEGCQSQSDEYKCNEGLKILRWSHHDAPHIIRQIAIEWNADYYIQGSYQILSINMQVGWHPEYKKLLGDGE